MRFARVLSASFRYAFLSGVALLGILVLATEIHMMLQSGRMDDLGDKVVLLAFGVMGAAFILGSWIAFFVHHFLTQKTPLRLSPVASSLLCASLACLFGATPIQMFLWPLGRVLWISLPFMFGVSAWFARRIHRTLWEMKPDLREHSA